MEEVYKYMGYVCITFLPMPQVNNGKYFAQIVEMRGYLAFYRIGPYLYTIGKLYHSVIKNDDVG